MEMKHTNHTFAVCAYKESPYLEECVQSLLQQSVQTNVILCTSTPCQYIEEIAKKYELPYYVREGTSDICDDWNFAVSCAGTDLVTVAHQDDVYEKTYVEHLLQYSDDPELLLFITDYLPLKNGQVGKRDINSILRRTLRTPLKWKWVARSPKLRQMTLAFGNSICCPSVTYHKKKTGEPVFTSKFKFCIDWDTFLKFAGTQGHFAYVDKPLVYYRIHSGATTKEFIVDHKRAQEDVEMFSKFWPKPIVRLIMVFYRKAYDTYN